MRQQKEEIYYGKIVEVIPGTRGGYMKIASPGLKPTGIAYCSRKSWGSRHAPQEGEVVVFSSPHLNEKGNWVAPEACPITPENGEYVREEALRRIDRPNHSGPFEDELPEYSKSKKGGKKKKNPVVQLNSRITGEWHPRERRSFEDN